MRAYIAIILSLCAAGVFAADHKEAPLVREDAAADLNDLYVFTSPANASNTVMIMTVNPFIAPNQNSGFVFSPDVRYEFHIDTNADQVDDFVYAVLFQGRGRTQNFSVELNGAPVASGTSTPPSIQPTPPAPTIVAGSNGEQIFAGQTDDPFFFDTVGFQKVLSGTGTFDGTDGFAGLNVSTIAIEVPTSVIANGSTNLQFYAATKRRRHTIKRALNGQFEQSRGEWEQIERTGVPAVSTVFISGPRKDEYNFASPADDVAGTFLADFGAVFTLFGTNAMNQGILASVAIPDTLKFDTTMGAGAGFPNGRRPQDDVIDVELSLTTNGGVAGDLVPANDVAFPATFPYLAPPQQP